MRRAGRTAELAFVMVVGLFLLTLKSNAQGTVTINFNGDPIQPPGLRALRTVYYELGMGFLAHSFYTRAFPPSPPEWPENGTAYIAPTLGMNCIRYDGLSFSPISMDLASYSSVVPEHDSSFVGQRADGSMVSTNFTVSGLIFQTYYFPPAFADWTNLWVKAGAVDNLKLRLPTIPPVMKMAIRREYGASWLHLSVQGTIGLRYRLEYTDVLPTTNWLTLTTFESWFYDVQFVQENLPPKRFFRAVEVP